MSVGEVSGASKNTEIDRVLLWRTTTLPPRLPKSLTFSFRSRSRVTAQSLMSQKQLPLPARMHKTTITCLRQQAQKKNFLLQTRKAQLFKSRLQVFWLVWERNPCFSSLTKTSYKELWLHLTQHCYMLKNKKKTFMSIWSKVLHTSGALDEREMTTNC